VGRPIEPEFTGCVELYAAAMAQLLHDEKAQGVCGTLRLLTEHDPSSKARGHSSVWIRASGRRHYTPPVFLWLPFGM